MTREEAIAQLKSDRDLCNFNPMTGEEEPMNEDCRKSAEALDIAINALEQESKTGRWIPCSERMPEERGVYIVTEKVYSINDRKHTGCFNLMTEQVEFSNGKWIRASFYEVIAWMPLPEPYKAESEDK